MLLMLLVLQGGMAAERSNTRRTMRPKVALVVGGGGAKGAAAIGALKYVERAGIPIDMVVGTSAGAIISGLYSVGYNAEQLDSIYCAQDWLRLLGDMAMPKLKPWSKVKGIPGVMRGDRFMQKLDTLLEQRTCHFDSLPIPLRCMAVDVRDFKEVCIDSGNVAQAIRASMAVPLAFTTVERDSMLLVDGGLLNNLPVDVARRMGADIVIAIDLMDAKRATQASRGQMRLKGLAAILEWQYVRPDLDKYRANRLDADLLIHPDVEGFNGASFGDEETLQLIANGEKAGREAWDELMDIKQRVVPQPTRQQRSRRAARRERRQRNGERRALHFQTVD